ncbi:MAG TPA: cation:proton antiporter [Candidatus Angelobacter sp.]|nr:cation:proton antiporter [Candidatus Angelobacter sp.]
MLPLDTVFQQIAAVLLVAAVIGAVGRLLRQPLIISFIAVGIVAGPLVLDIVRETEEIELLAQIGISLLLFIVGLKLDVRLIRTLGPVALATGLGQVAFTSGVGFLLTLAMGFDPVTSLYIAIALTFSSTIIIVKLLSDKGETEQLHGRIAIGFLIVQDIVVILVMIGLSAFGGARGEEADLLVELGLVAVRGVLFVTAIVGLMRWAMPPLLHWLARTPELLVLFSIAWAVALAVAGDLLGFSEEVGAFLAGLSLAATPYREALAARLTTLRDFLLLFFFVDLGARMTFGDAASQLAPAAVLSAFVLIGNPIIVMVIMGVMRYRKRVGFLAGLTVAQISEFSLIFAALGLGLGHITEETLGLITTVGIITIGVSTYMILNSHWLFERLEPLLDIFERDGAADPDLDDGPPAPDVVVMGLGRYGGEIASALADAGREVLGVDFDPAALDQLRERGLRVAYGDVEDPDLPGVLPLERAAWVVSSVRALDANLALLQAFDHHGFAGRVAVSADRDHDAELLREHGAALVLMPLRDAAAAAVERIGSGD